MQKNYHIDKENIDKKQARKQRIIECGLKVFCEKGYDGATVDDIVKTAGCSHGLFYHYFKNKKEIFEHVIARHADYSFDELKISVDNEKSYREKLKIIVNTMFEMLTKDENYSYYFYLFVSQSFSNKNNPASRTRVKHCNHPFALLDSIFTNGQTAGEITTKYSVQDCKRMLICIIQGATLGYVLAPKEILSKVQNPNIDFILDIFTNLSN